ncbi:MAG TPA: histidine kinase [Parafilimonas sp.]|nr:histidine kinase [Parafilimonas sp.]
MRVSKKISLLFLVCLIAGCSFAQERQNEIKPDQFRAVQWTIDDGLPSNLANAMFKDAKGFLWIGSIHGELCRFDGSVFKKYFPDQQKRGLINSDIIFSFKEDSLHNIWIGTAKGLSRYDLRADTFTNFSPFIDSAFPDLTIAPFWATKDEVYCMEPGSLITAINVHTLKRRKLKILEADKFGIHWNTNKSSFDVKSNSIWTLAKYRQSGALEQIFLDHRKNKYYSWPCYRNSVKHLHDAEDMRYDTKRNSIWINSGDGLLEFSLYDTKFHHIEALNEFIKLKDYDRYVGIDIDKEGRIWLATKPGGILIYDPETQHIQQVFSDPGLQQKTGEYNLHIYCDRDGIVWTSYFVDKGIYELLPFNPIFKRYTANPYKKDSLSSGLISTIVPGAKGKLWIGTANGLNIFDPETERFEVLREKDLPGIKGIAIIPLYIDTITEKAWLNAGSQETDRQYFSMNMYEMDTKTRRCKRIVFMDGPKQVDSLLIAPAWIRPYKNGIIFCEDNHGVFEIKKGSLIANLLVSFKPGKYGFGGFVQEEDRHMFLGALYPPNFTFENKNGKWTKVPHLLDSLFWLSMLYNKKDQTFWVSLKNELVHFDKEFRRIKTYGQEEGYNGPMLNMLLDNNGNLWFVNSLKQVGRLNPANGIITTLSEIDDYHKQDYGEYPPATKDVRGNLYFGSGYHVENRELNYELDRIYPERYSSAPTSTVYLRSLDVNQNPFSSATGVNNLQELSLNYNQSTISIETGIIDYYAKGKGHIRYKLEENGKEKDWQYAPAYFTIRYEGLQPGSYRLVIQASNAGNEFNSPLKILMIDIRPPFWQTWWFRITAVVCAAALFYGAIRWRVQQKFRSQLEQSEKERQVAELQQQKTEVEMQALRAQMNPHFIFNSLNSINRFILQNNKVQASEYLTKFSRLVRMILQNSQESFITLENELESLQLYVSLEALRFDDHFDYRISVIDDLDTSIVKVPPLIIQPYVENAIWHGLMHKEEKGQLNIDVWEENKFLYLKVSDNGIGRKQAALLASKSATKHKSMGLEITAHRIAMIQNAEEGGSAVTFNDLVEPDGSAAGTEVTIKMPLMYD